VKGDYDISPLCGIQKKQTQSNPNLFSPQHCWGLKGCLKKTKPNYPKRGRKIRYQMTEAGGKMIFIEIPAIFRFSCVCLYGCRKSVKD
jgi:hypothetical protein